MQLMTKKSLIRESGCKIVNLAILQARMTSTRLPGKVLKSINNQPMLLFQIQRIMKSTKIDKLIVATTIEKEDDIIVELCEKNNISFFRGSLENVLDRFYQAALKYNPENIIRLTGDCPLIDPEIIDKVITQHILNGNDYTSNCITPTYPDGMDVEVLTFETLKKLIINADRQSHREHVTLYINENKDKFKMENVFNTEDLSDIRLTVDEAEDLQLIRIIYSEMKYRDDFNLDDVIRLLRKRGNLLEINKFYKRNEGLETSLKNETTERRC